MGFCLFWFVLTCVCPYCSIPFFFVLCLVCVLCFNFGKNDIRYESQTHFEIIYAAEVSFKSSFNTNISSAISTHTFQVQFQHIFQVQFQHTYFKHSFKTPISSQFQHTHTHTNSILQNLKTQIMTKNSTHTMSHSHTRIQTQTIKHNTHSKSNNDFKKIVK